MRVYLLFIFLIVFFTSCSTNKKVLSNDVLIGDFHCTIKGPFPNTSTQYFLELKNDSNFLFKISGHDYSSVCSGIWEKKNDLLFLKCKEEKNVATILSSGYMSQREFKIEILNKNKLKLDKIILKRQ